MGLTWGRYFRLDADEETKTVDLVNKSKDGGFLTIRKGVEKLRGVFDIKDVDAYLAELEAEKAERLKQEQQIAAQAMRLEADIGNENQDDDGQANEPGARARGAGSSRSRKA
jgi:hypothetical protein